MLFFVQPLSKHVGNRVADDVSARLDSTAVSVAAWQGQLPIEHRTQPGLQRLVDCDFVGAKIEAGFLLL